MKTISVWLTHKDVSCWNISEKQINYLKQNIPDAEIIHCRNQEEFISSLPKTEIAVIWIFKQEWFNQASNLKVIITPAAGKDLFHVNEPDNIIIEHSSFHGKIIGETVLGMILSHCRGISYLLWNKILWARPELDKRNRPFKRSRITILGFGSIGRETAGLCKALGANIYGVKRTETEPPSFFTENDRIILINELDKILPETDHLVLALPATEQSTDLVNKEVFKLLPEHAAVYNVGRGNAINEEDLISALNNREIAAAYLDVFKTEPLPEDSPLRNCPNCFIMPHGSAISPDYLDLFIDEFLEKYKKWKTDGLSVKHIENKDTEITNECKWKAF